MEGRWQKEGRSGADKEFPGSYGGWVKPRRSVSSYPKTSQQKKVAEAGRDVGATCKGKSGSSFKACRHDVMKKHFG